MNFGLSGLTLLTGHAFITLPARGEGVSGTLLFSPTQTEEGIIILPLNDYSSGLTLRLRGYMLSATADKVALQALVMAVQANDAKSVEVADFDTVNDDDTGVGTTVPGTIKYPFDVTITCTNDGGPSAGPVTFIILIRRDHDNAYDTALGDYKLLSIEGSYTPT